MAVKNPVMGMCACPICGAENQELRVSVNDKPYLNCDDCGVQIFTRSAKSARCLKAKINQPEQTPVKVVAAVASSPSEPEKKPEAKPAQAVKPVAPVAEEPEEPKMKRNWWTGELEAVEGVVKL